MDTMTLREAAQRTARSVTTLRRYIRAGRLNAEKRAGRFGPEYFVSVRELASAGLETVALERPAGPSRRSYSRAENGTLDVRTAERILREAVPLSLYQDLQMKHEQLLVQYGMVRASGMRVFELQAELEARQRQVDEAREEAARLRRQMTQETTRLKRMLRQAELEQEGRGLEIAALREKVRALEMLTRNAATSDSIERQFSEVMAQAQRVDRLFSDRRAPNTGPEPTTRPRQPQGEPEH